MRVWVGTHPFQYKPCNCSHQSLNVFRYLLPGHSRFRSCFIAEFGCQLLVFLVEESRKFSSSHFSSNACWGPVPAFRNRPFELGQLDGVVAEDAGPGHFQALVATGLGLEGETLGSELGTLG